MPAIPIRGSINAFGGFPDFANSAIGARVTIKPTEKIKTAGKPAHRRMTLKRMKFIALFSA